MIWDMETVYAIRNSTSGIITAISGPHSLDYHMDIIIIIRIDHLQAGASVFLMGTPLAIMVGTTGPGMHPGTIITVGTSPGDITDIPLMDGEDRHSMVPIILSSTISVI